MLVPNTFLDFLLERSTSSSIEMSMDLSSLLFFCILFKCFEFNYPKTKNLPRIVYIFFCLAALHSSYLTIFVDFVRTFFHATGLKRNAQPHTMKTKREMFPFFGIQTTKFDTKHEPVCAIHAKCLH